MEFVEDEQGIYLRVFPSSKLCNEICGKTQKLTLIKNAPINDSLGCCLPKNDLANCSLILKTVKGTVFRRLISIK